MVVSKSLSVSEAARDAIAFISFIWLVGARVCLRRAVTIDKIQLPSLLKSFSIIYDTYYENN